MLIVDDDTNLIEILEVAVNSLGISTLTATATDTALEIFEKEQPELVLSDITIEPYDGLEFLEKVRNINSDAILMVVSGQDDDPTQSRALQLGVEAFFKKPFNLVDFHKRLQSILLNNDVSCKNL